MHSPVRQFLVYVAILLLPCFALWTVVSGLLAVPATGLVNLLLSNWFPDIVHSVAANNGEALLLTRFGEDAGSAVPLAQADYRLAFSLNTRILSYSLAFYTTLHFATHRQAFFGSYINGFILLYGLFVAGLAALGVKELQQNLPTPFANQDAVWIPGANLVAICYQLSVLIVPTVAPVAVWLFQNRDAEILRDLPGLNDRQREGEGSGAGPDRALGDA